ncbi:hypothetical protein TSUD_144300 [Trifolium subterraneum]|uniref:Reverse transcriptase domain-containing protein n=1 Tax=Trifolium subterraneum TaxID=3900 RepID=A0A2Z6NTR6_TRISU|nr:hypothetical protein TSUD_144300 [Trifolium subterraneum]
MAHPNLDGLSLQEEEEEGFVFDFEEEGDEQVDLRWCLVGRFLCDKSIHFNSMKVRMAELWNPVKGVTIKEAMPGTFLFHFSHPLDMEAVLKGGPWTFDNNMLILEQIQLGMQIEHIPLFHVLLWVQVHNLPMGLMKEKDPPQVIKTNHKVTRGNHRISMPTRTIPSTKIDPKADQPRPDKKPKHINPKANPIPNPNCKTQTHDDDTQEMEPGLPGPMKILSWNCRGLSTPSAIPNLRNIAQGHQPDILFLSETLSKAQTMERVRVSLKFNSCLSVDVEGRSGGLSVMWRDTIKCRVMNYSRNFINLVVEDKEEGEWQLTCYYGYPERGRRSQAWELLRELRDMSDLPWCIIGDFNDLLSQEDKRGNHPHPNWLCNGFKTAVGDCDFTDIHLEGYPYTWIKSRGSSNVIEERLDRAMANSMWLMKYPDVRLLNLLASHSDHSPILLQSSPMVRNGTTYTFRFENMWLKEEDVEEVVVDGWGRERGVDITSRTTRCADKLQRWGRRKRMKFKQEVAECGEEMEVKSGQRCIGYEKDTSTQSFSISSAKQRKKKIESLVNEVNVEVKSQREICEVAMNYFDNLFKANATIHEPILSLIAPKVTQEDNERLVAPITREELKEALFQMHPDKAPGPDGFNPAFYQHFWEMCGNDIFEAAKEWLDRGFFPSSLNDTNICLIPKCENPVSMKDMRPISLCNVLYKMVSKLLANRLKMCLEKCVSEEQSAFIEGRSILDNALIAIEVIHALKRKTTGRRGELALKIDISKAYDKIDWGFLRGRGLRQGDHLSPYLFILVTEGLTALIKNSVARGDLHGVKICRGAPTVSHLLFADDCFLFCRNVSMAAQEDLSRIMGVRHVLGTGNYLGLPSMIGRKKKDIFAYIKDRVWKRINSWRGRALSKAGKDVMIKSVLHAIPSYVMSVYLLPETTIKEMERMMNSFWWGGGAHNKGIRWLAWDRMAYPKALGGMGFRDLHTFNLAMIAKQGWNIMTKPHTLVAKLYKARGLDPIAASSRCA